MSALGLAGLPSATTGLRESQRRKPPPDKTESAVGDCCRWNLSYNFLSLFLIHPHLYVLWFSLVQNVGLLNLTLRGERVERVPPTEAAARDSTTEPRGYTHQQQTSIASPPPTSHAACPYHLSFSFYPDTTSRFESRFTEASRALQSNRALQRSIGSRPAIL